MLKNHGSMNCLQWIVTALFVVVATQAAALDENAIIQQIQALDWQVEPGKYELAGTKASITTTSEEYLLQGKDAHEFMRISEGHDGFKPDALIVYIDGPNQDTQALFTYNEIGFIKMDDWEENIDKDALLKEIQHATEEANKIKEEGYPKIYIDGWAQEPYLDKANAVVYWAISAHTNEGVSIINAKAMKLGRKGFVEIAWMGSDQQFANAQESLSPSLASFQYDEGSRYTDYIPGTDTVATVGAGALAYKLITGKAAAKTGLLALALIFAKKFWFLIFIPFIFAWKWIKGRFTGSKDSA